MTAPLRAILLACAFTAALAGGYGRGKPHLFKPRPEEYVFNYVPAAAHAAGANGPALPAAFSWCTNDNTSRCVASWNQHISTPFAPGYCGSCWAHATLSMLQDRLKINKGGGTDIMLGRQTLLNCAGFHGDGDGCNGGEPINVFKYMHKYGLPDEACMPYSGTDHHAFKEKGMRRCPADKYCINCMPKAGKPGYECWPVRTPLSYKVTGWSKLEAGEEAMMAEIKANGPIVCGIACPDDFTFHYHSASVNGGVWIDNSGDTELDHDIEVVGWGVDEKTGTKFWHIRNSWGTYWGELGFFKLQRGVNALQVESGDCWAASIDHRVEDAVRDGCLEGSMYGLKEGQPDKCERSRGRRAGPSQDAAAALASR